LNMRFRVAEIDNQPTAIFTSEDQRRNELLSQLLLPSTEFAVNLLYDITRVERGWDSTYSYSRHQVVSIRLFKDRMTLTPYDKGDGRDLTPIEIPLDSAKLILFRWGLTLHRWEMKRKKMGI
jgi:hypothetical protein